MKKLILIILMVVVLVAQPLQALAWCCKAVHYSTFNVVGIDDLPSSEVKEVQTEDECLDTCKSWADTLAGAAAAVPSLVTWGFAAIRANMHCQNFYRKDASVRSFDAACVSPTLSCCQVHIDERIIPWRDEANLVFSVNYQPGETESECAYYCKHTVGCTSTFFPNSNPNRKTGKCEPIVADQKSTIDGAQNDGFRVGDYEFDKPTDPLKYAGYNPALVLAKIINGLLLILGTISLLMFIYAGVLWMTDQGAGSNIKKARSILVWSTSGLILIFVAYIAVGYLLETFTAI